MPDSSSEDHVQSNSYKFILYSKLNTKQISLKYPCIVPENRKKLYFNFVLFLERNAINASLWRLYLENIFVFCYMYLSVDRFQYIQNKQKTYGSKTQTWSVDPRCKSGTEDGLFIVKWF